MNGDARDQPDDAQRAAALSGRASSFESSIGSFLRDAPLPLDEPMPERVGGYRVVRVLGRGGMGVVYEAEQESTRRFVALKLIHSHLTTPRYRRRFSEEIRTLGRFEHAGIARIHDAGAAPDDRGSLRLYFAMELAAGLRIDEHVVAQRLDDRAVAELIAQVCDAVHHAHQKGVIHCDLKPANIIVAADGTPKVLDFGIARIMEDDSSTMTHSLAGEQGIVGTLAFASPEQASGDRNRLDVLTDVYGLGAVLHALVAGRAPHDLCSCSLMQAVEKVRDGVPPRLRTLRADCPIDLDTIAAKAMARVPSDRYVSAAAMADDLRRFGTGRPIAARPVSWTESLRKWIRRNTRSAATIAAASLACVSMTIALAVTSIKWRAAAFQAIDARREHEETRQALQRSSLPMAGRFRLSRNFTDHLASDEAPSGYTGRVLRAFGAGPDPNSIAGLAKGRLLAVDNNGNVIDALDGPRAVPPGARPRFDTAGRFEELASSPVDSLTLCALPLDINGDGTRELVRGLQLPNIAMHLSVLETDTVASVVSARGKRGTTASQLWNHGDFQDAVWDEDHKLLWCVATAEDLAWYVPQLSSWDSAGCPGGAIDPLVLVALDKDSLDGVLPPLAGDAQHRPVRPRYAFATRPPHAVRDPADDDAPPLPRAGRMDDDARSRWLQVQAFEPYDHAHAGKRGRLYVMFHGRGDRADFIASVELDDRGTPIGPFQLAPTHADQADAAAALVMSQFDPAREIISFPLGSLVDDVPEAERLMQECRDVESAIAAATASRRLTTEERNRVCDCLRAMNDNWRWLEESACEIVERDDVIAQLGDAPGDRADDFATAADRLKRAIAIHASRCPRHDAGTCVYDRYLTTAMALARAALGEWDACDADARRALELPPGARDDRSWDALNHGLRAIALHGLGREDEAQAQLAMAEQSASAVDHEKDDGSAYRFAPRVLERARELLEQR
ncbi:MAG: serine/threonine-protein kinase [Phycisphaerales bacterium]